MAENKLNAIPRSERGKNEMHRLRVKGMIPAVFYGAHYENKPIAVNLRELEQALTRKKGLVNLSIEGTGDYEVLLREIQRDPVTDRIKHVDFMGITRGEKITATVSLVLKGEALGVKTAGGIIEINRRQLEIECLPKDLPDKIEVDVSGLEIGDSIHVEDLQVENIVFMDNPKTTILSVAAPTVLKTAKEEEAEAAAAAATEEGEAEKKEGEEEEEK